MAAGAHVDRGLAVSFAVSAGGDLAAAANLAEVVAASVPLTGTQHFVAKRRAIRAALAEDGVAEIEALVSELLPS